MYNTRKTVLGRHACTIVETHAVHLKDMHNTRNTCAALETHAQLQHLEDMYSTRETRTAINLMKRL